MTSTEYRQKARLYRKIAENRRMVGSISAACDAAEEADRCDREAARLEDAGHGIDPGDRWTAFRND